MNKEILSILYDKAQELTVTDEYIRYKEQYVKAREELLKVIGEQYRRNIEELNDITSKMTNEACKQCFNEGYSIAVRLFIEATYKGRDDQE